MTQGKIGRHSALFVAEFVANAVFWDLRPISACPNGGQEQEKARMESSKENPPHLKKLMDKRKTASLSEAVSSVATNSHLAGGVYRARTYDLHDVNVALWPAELRPQARNIVYICTGELSTLFFNFFEKTSGGWLQTEVELNKIHGRATVVK